MPYSTINGSNSWTGAGMWSQPNFSGPIWIPQTRPGHNGERPIRIINLHAFVSGYQTSSAVGYCYVGGQFIGASGLAYQNYYGTIAHTAWFGGGGYLSRGSGYWDTLSMNTNNRAIHMGYRSYGGININNVTGYVWRNRSFIGGFNFVEVPTAPSTPWVTNITSNAMTINFNPSSDDGGSGITGYLMHLSTSPNFTNVATYGVSPSTRIYGLTPGTQYWIRVFAMNEFYSRYEIGSQWSGTATATTIIEPPRWTDTTLPTLMRVGTPYSDGVSAYTQKEPLTYSISSGQLPNGISLNITTGAITGTPTLAAIQNGPTYNFSIRATNAGGTATTSFSRTIVAEQSSWSDNIISPEMRVAQPYSDAVSATGTGVEYSVGPLGPLPRPDTYQVVPGVLLNRTTGIISGTPTSPGIYDITIYATNDSAEFDPSGIVQQTFRITVRPTGKRYISTTDNQYVQVIRRWNGNEWQDISVARKWDGTKWVFLEMQ